MYPLDFKFVYSFPLKNPSINIVLFSHARKFDVILYGSLTLIPKQNHIRLICGDPMFDGDITVHVTSNPFSAIPCSIVRHFSVFFVITAGDWKNIYFASDNHLGAPNFEASLVREKKFSSNLKTKL